MITGYKKALLTTAVVMAVSGFNVYAARILRIAENISQK